MPFCRFGRSGQAEAESREVRESGRSSLVPDVKQARFKGKTDTKEAFMSGQPQSSCPKLFLCICILFPGPQVCNVAKRRSGDDS